MATSISGTTSDCADPVALATLWAELLGFEIIDPSPEGALIVDGSEAGFWIWFQKAPEGKAAKNRFHLDLQADDLQEEIARAESLAAITLARHAHDSWTWVVMQDPEGNEFDLGTAVPTVGM